MSQPVIVIGMGRSGTSFLSSLIQHLGVSFGSELVPPDVINPRGFWEDAGFVAFHRRLKQRLYSRHVGDPEFDSGLVDAIIPFQATNEEEEEANALVGRFNGTEIWGWKDPRTVLFVDYWLSRLPDAKLIIPYRHPVEVLISYLKRVVDPRLMRRSDQVFRSYSVIYQHVLEVIELKPQQCLTLYTQAAFADAPQLTQKLAAFLGLRPEGRAKAPEFFREEFSRIRITMEAERLFRLLFPEAAACFDKLNKVAQIPFAGPEAGTGDGLGAAALQLASVDGARSFAADLVPLLVRLYDPRGKGYFEQLAEALDRVLCH